MNILRHLVVYNAHTQINGEVTGPVTYVVTRGQIDDIACYFKFGEHEAMPVAREGEKLTEANFRVSPAFYDFEASGLHYRR